MFLSGRLTRSKTAVIVIDMQNDFCHEEGALVKKGKDVTLFRKIIPCLQNFINSAKEYKVPIIYVKTIHHEYTNSEVWTSRSNKTGEATCKPYTWGTEFYGVVPEEKDIVIEKHRYNAFFNTPLDSALSTLNIKNLIITGVSTSVCVDTTAREAFMRDYQVIVPTDTTAAFTNEEHSFSLKLISQYFGVTCLSKEILDEWGE